jgi:CRISPR-associated protein Csd2
MAKNVTTEEIRRSVGLLVIEVRASNPNGDPDRESDPRQRPDGKGEISPVSFKRKLRDLVLEKEGGVWKVLSEEMELSPDHFQILEARGRNREQIKKELDGDDMRKFKEKYWDGRVFGNTFLEEGGSDTIRTGIVQFGLGISVAPIEIERQTNTSKAGVEDGKDRGMAPMGYRVVQHGVYCMPFFVNPNLAHRSGCTAKDIELLKRLIPYAYSHTRSHIRNNVDLIHAWYVEHKNNLGSFSDFSVLDALTPKKKEEFDKDKPSGSRAEYDIPEIKNLPDSLKSKIGSIKDLLETE